MAIRGDSAGLEKQYLLDLLTSDVGSILEVGCGDGRLTRKYADVGRQVIGIDLPSTLPRGKGDALPETVSVVAASALRLPFPADYFDQAIFSLSF